MFGISNRSKIRAIVSAASTGVGPSREPGHGPRLNDCNIKADRRGNPGPGGQRSASRRVRGWRVRECGLPDRWFAELVLCDGYPSRHRVLAGVDSWSHLLAAGGPENESTGGHGRGGGQ